MKTAKELYECAGDVISKLEQSASFYADDSRTLLIDAFAHTHSAVGMFGDSCAICGHDLRHELHTQSRVPVPV